MAIDTHGSRADHPQPAASEDAVELTYRGMPILTDYLRASAGLLLAAGPLVAVDPPWAVRLGLVALALLFAAFLFQTWERQHARVRLSSAGVALLGRTERRIAWPALDGLRLRWFGPRRQNGGGWLELELRGAGQRIVVTSALNRFDDLVAEAAQAAQAAQVPLDPATQANLAAFLGRAA
jgi:hypothetical protein